MDARFRNAAGPQTFWKKSEQNLRAANIGPCGKDCRVINDAIICDSNHIFCLPRPNVPFGTGGARTMCPPEADTRFLQKLYTFWLSKTRAQKVLRSSPGASHLASQNKKTLRKAELKTERRQGAVWRWAEDCPAESRE